MISQEHINNLVSGLPWPMLVAIIVLSIFVLSKGADWMIEGVVDLARRTGLPKIVIGATVISLGTTMPEAFVSAMAAWMGNPGLALGNGVGSIIADTGLIFGLTVTLSAVPVDRYILNRTGWVQFGSANLLVLVAVGAWLIHPDDPVLGRPVGLFFLILLAGYLYAAYIWAKKGAKSAAMAEHWQDDLPRPLLLCWIMTAGGLLMVIASARMLVPAASQIAFRIGVPDDVIAATMVAFGTSLPELTTAVASVRKGHPEITVGNVVGADVLNCLFVIGAAAAARPLEVPINFFLFHFPAMLAILWSFRVFISFNKGDHFQKWRGAWLLGVYLLYVLGQYGFNLGV